VSNEWDFYVCNVNNQLASIFLDLGLRKLVPDRDKPNLLWVWVQLKWPREDGLSASSEFEPLRAIEEKLTETLDERFGAVLCGGITTDGRREFYYYGPRSDGLEPVVGDVMIHFQGYEFNCGCKVDSEWRQYLDVLYPSDEDQQRIKNRKVLDVLQQKNDTLRTPRDVSHWIYFRAETDREEFRRAVLQLEYRAEADAQTGSGDFPFGLRILRFQSVMPSELDDAVIELCRLAEKHRGDYDGWETQVISNA